MEPNSLSELDEVEKEKLLKEITEHVSKNAGFIRAYLEDSTALLDAEKTKALREREVRWQERSIDQLAFFNNLLIVLGTGFLGYAFDKGGFNNLSFSEWNNLLFISLTGMFFSLLFGLLCGYNRMIDFRATYQITGIRRKFYTLNPTDYIKITNAAKGKAGLKENARLAILWIPVYWFAKPKFYSVTDEELKGGTEANRKLQTIRELNYRLGKCTRRLSAIQLMCFFISIICFGLNFYFK